MDVLLLCLSFPPLFVKEDMCFSVCDFAGFVSFLILSHSYQSCLGLPGPRGRKGVAGKPGLPG